MADNVLDKLYEALEFLEITCIGECEHIRQTDTYYDTTNYKLMYSKSSLRIRRIGANSFVTIKRLLEENVMLKRNEFEHALPSDDKSNMQVVVEYFLKYFPEYQNYSLNEVMIRVLNNRYIIPIETACCRYNLCFDKYEYYNDADGQSSDFFMRLK